MTFPSTPHAGAAHPLGSTRLLVCRAADGPAEGVVTDVDLVTLLAGRAP